MSPIQTEEKLKIAYQVAQEKKALSPVVLDLRELAGFTDYFLICSVESPQQMKAIVEDIYLRLKAIGSRMDHREGVWDSSWMLLDYGDIIVHIFTEEARSFYGLEELWNTAKEVEF